LITIPNFLENNGTLDTSTYECVQKPYDIPLYWWVHKDTQKWLIVIPVELGSISSSQKTANNEGELVTTHMSNLLLSIILAVE